DLRTLFAVDPLAPLGKVFAERVDRLAVALELHRGDAEVAEDFPRRRRVVRGAELAIRVFVARAVRILEGAQPRAEVRAGLVRDGYLRACSRRERCQAEAQPQCK